MLSESNFPPCRTTEKRLGILTRCSSLACSQPNSPPGAHPDLFSEQQHHSDKKPGAGCGHCHGSTHAYSHSGFTSALANQMISYIGAPVSTGRHSISSFSHLKRFSEDWTQISNLQTEPVTAVQPPLHSDAANVAICLKFAPFFLPSHTSENQIILLRRR